jgi:hypothetical protein
MSDNLPAVRGIDLRSGAITLFTSGTLSCVSMGDEYEET